MKRSGGLLLHITSLPSDEGIGSLDGAGLFLDFMKKSGSTFWQVLPLNIPDMANSPYSSVSAFAANPLLIGTSKLLEGFGHIKIGKAGGASDIFDPVRAKEYKTPLFKFAFDNFSEDPEYCVFAKRNWYWLNDYALFTALSEEYGSEWNKWEARYKKRDEKALAEFSEDHSREIGYHMFLQYVFHKQWTEMKNEANRTGIKLMGDIPFYVSYESADVWASPHDFKLDGDLLPKKVSGVPPDYFSTDGQLWGNPIYDFENMHKSGYAWWLNRIKHARTLYDCVRIDHFRAFDAYYEVNAGAENARKGKWIKGDSSLVGEIIKAAGNMQIVAEDLGVQSKGLQRLMTAHKLPGMKVLQFAFDGGADNPFLPHNYPENCVAYIGTHDNDTVAGWWKTLDPQMRERVYSYTGMESGNEVNRKFMKLLCRSKADLVIFSFQDIINSEIRMNTPGTTTGNWEFMLKARDIKDCDAEYIRDLNEMYGRKH